MEQISTCFVAAFDSTYRWGSSVTPGARGAKWPPVRAAGIGIPTRRDPEISRNGNPSRPGAAFCFSPPPRDVQYPSHCCIGDMCAVWEGRARGKMPYAGGVGAVLEEWQRQRQRQWQTVSSRAAYSWFRAGARRPAFPRVGRGGPWAGKGGGRSARGEPAGRKGSGRANGSVPRSHFFPHFL